MKLVNHKENTSLIILLEMLKFISCGVINKCACTEAKF